MSKSLVPTHLKTHIASQLKESINEPANTAYYVFAGKHTAYANGSIPTPQDSYQELLYSSHQNMIFGKRVADSDVSLMVPKIEWTQNTVYQSYDSNTVIFGTNFYAAVNSVSNYHVFKVLDNNRGVPSQYPPDINDPEAAADSEFYSTADGYVWKYMYSVTSTVWNKFATDNYMPVSTNANVVGNAVSGAIDVIRVVSGGSNYDATFQGIFSTSQIQVGGNPTYYTLPETASPNSDFYTSSCIHITTGSGSGQTRKIVGYNGPARRITVNSAFTTTLSNTSTYAISPLINIDGDGTGAVARGLVNTASTNSLYQVEILNRGQNYTYATLTVGGNTSGVSNPAILTPVFAPRNGHGSNAALELGATAIGFGLSFANNESGNIPTTNDFRTIGILRDPQYANVVLTINLPSLTGSFIVGGTVSQVDTNAAGKVVSFNGATLQLTNVVGGFSTGKVVYQSNNTANVATANVNSYTINNIQKDFNTFDQRYKCVVNPVSGTFLPDETVYQLDNESIVGANAAFHSSNSTVFTITNLRGAFNPSEQIVGATSGAIANLQSIREPDLVRYSGEVIYIENIDPVSRSNTQTEQIKVVLKF